MQRGVVNHERTGRRCRRALLVGRSSLGRGSVGDGLSLSQLVVSRLVDPPRDILSSVAVVLQFSHQSAQCSPDEPASSANGKLLTKSTSRMTTLSIPCWR